MTAVTTGFRTCKRAIATLIAQAAMDAGRLRGDQSDLAETGVVNLAETGVVNEELDQSSARDR